MAIISIFSADYCREDEVVNELVKKTGFQVVSDSDVIREAAMLANMEEEKIARAFTNKRSVFDRFTHEKDYAIAHIKLALSKMLLVSVGNDYIFHGYNTELIPRDITHILRVGLIADKGYRVSVAQEQGLSSKDAEKLITKADEESAKWLLENCNVEKPFDKTLYDLIIPMNKESVEDAADLVAHYLGKDILEPTEASLQAMDDFGVAARVEVALAKKGHDVHVSCYKGNVTITINKKVARLNKLSEELKELASIVNGVQSVEVKPGEGFYEADVYRKFDVEMPSKVLLVDDEQEFVQTLSERLALRDMGSAVVHDGQSAVKLVAEDPPDVMVLDLKMPGMDGLETLKRVKETHPDTEVIILTGHGSAKDEEECMKLGAFAYLHKPVDIQKLSQIVKEANKKAVESRKKQG